VPWDKPAGNSSFLVQNCKNYGILYIPPTTSFKQNLRRTWEENVQKLDQVQAPPKLQKIKQYDEDVSFCSWLV